MSCVMYDTPAGTFAGREHCLGHLDQMGNVYDVPVGVSAGQNHIVGHVEGPDGFQGAAALLLLLRPQGGGNYSGQTGQTRTGTGSNLGGGVLVFLIVCVLLVLFLFREYLSQILTLGAFGAIILVILSIMNRER